MKYGEEITEEIAELIAQGNNRTDSCLLAGIHYDTFCVWMKKPEFSDAIKKAEATFKRVNITFIQAAALKSWQAAAWLLERRYRDEYALRIEDHGKSKEEINKEAMAAALNVLKVIEQAGKNATNSSRDTASNPGGLEDRAIDVQAEKPSIQSL
jgi:hypothetical protein